MGNRRIGIEEIGGAASSPPLLPLPFIRLSSSSSPPPPSVTSIHLARDVSSGGALTRLRPGSSAHHQQIHHNDIIRILSPEALPSVRPSSRRPMTCFNAGDVAAARPSAAAVETLTKAALSCYFCRTVSAVLSTVRLSAVDVKALRAFRVLRPLKLVSGVPSKWSGYD